MTAEEYNDKPTGSGDGRDDLVSRLVSLDVPLLQQPGPFTETRAIISEAVVRISQLDADASEAALQYMSDTGQLAEKVDALMAERDALRAALDRAEADKAAAVEALSELLDVSRRAVRVSFDHSDFKLYAMEPMHHAIAAAAAAIRQGGAA